MPHPVHVPELAFPDYEALPAQRAQQSLASLVARPVLIKLGAPEWKAGLGHPTVRAPGVTMPEAAVDEDHSSLGSKDQVGMPWEIDRVQAIAVSQTRYKPPDGQLGLGVLVPHAGHPLAALQRRQSVQGIPKLPTSCALSTSSLTAAHAGRLTSVCFASGSSRTRTPVAAKTALATAAAMGGTAGSPRPPGRSSEAMNSTRTSGASARRIIS